MQTCSSMSFFWLIFLFFVYFFGKVAQIRMPFSLRAKQSPSYGCPSGNIDQRVFKRSFSGLTNENL